MKIKINKALFFIFLCSIVMPIALFSGWKDWLGLSESNKEAYSGLFNLILDRFTQDSVNEDSARRIFENRRAQFFMPKWYSLRTKIGFMDGFIEYSESRFKSEPSGNRVRLADFCRIVSMATTYLGYLNKPFITGKDVALVGVGAAVPKVLSRLKGDLSILAGFVASAKFVLERLRVNREWGLL